MRAAGIPSRTGWASLSTTPSASLTWVLHGLQAHWDFHQNLLRQLHVQIALETEHDDVGKVSSLGPMTIGNSSPCNAPCEVSYARTPCIHSGAHLFHGPPCRQ